jgi:hypothetical protein
MASNLPFHLRAPSSSHSRTASACSSPSRRYTTPAAAHTCSCSCCAGCAAAAVQQAAAVATAAVVAGVLQLCSLEAFDGLLSPPTAVAPAAPLPGSNRLLKLLARRTASLLLMTVCASWSGGVWQLDFLSGVKAAGLVGWMQPSTAAQSRHALAGNAFSCCSGCCCCSGCSGTISGGRPRSGMLSSSLIRAVPCRQAW